MNVFIATSTFGEAGGSALDVLTRAGLKWRLNSLRRTMREDEVIRELSECVGVIAGTERYTPLVLESLPQLRVISRCGAGTDTIDTAAALQKGIQIRHTPSAPTQSVVELTIAFVLALIRRIPTSDRNVRNGTFTKTMGYLIQDLRFGLLGLGRVGKSVAGILRDFGAEVWGYDICPDAEWAIRRGVSLKPREDILREVDVLCVHLPYEKNLRHSIGKKELFEMRPKSFLVNTSRGGLIDEEALLDALTGGHLSGAAIDTFETEPYAGPLRTLENVILTPHVGSYSRGCRISMENESAENLIDALRGLALPNAASET